MYRADMMPNPAVIVLILCAAVAATAGIAALLDGPKWRKPSRLQIGLLAAIGLLVACFATPLAKLVSPIAAPLLPHRSNSLAINQHAKVSGAVQLKIEPPVDINFKTRAAVMQARTAAVDQHPELLLSEYEPSYAVFGMIEDGRPWWGTKGMAYYGPGKRSIRGPSMHSTFIMNPFMLAGITPAFGLRGSHKVYFIPDERIDALSLYCRPVQHEWFPTEGRSHVVFDMTSYIKDLERATAVNSFITPIDPPYLFSVLAYNARDMGLEYMSIPQEEMQNVVNSYRGKEAFIIPQFFHCGDSCGYPGGCNNQSPPSAELDRLGCTSLPAKLQVRFYKYPPSASDRADFVCDIDII